MPKAVAEVEVAGFQAPRPTNPSIVLQEVPGGLYAAVVFAGRPSERSVLGRKERLRGDIAADNLLAKDNTWVLAKYNGMWTPPQYRRNEVFLPIKHDSFILWNGKPAP